ncbi:uncharacterized protein LOC141877943 [Acropora palmata]|uniref:uncharacterized protein LOC141877943 n=1 Tax=Acropora palmata TaxID=6131 RepID=UPI003D9FFE19
MALSKIVIAITILVILGNCHQLLCWNRGGNARFFDGSLLVQPNSAMQMDIIKSFRTLGAIQCGHACLSEGNCVAQTFCGDHGNSGNGMCFLHKNGIREEEKNLLVRDDKCTYQQYFNFNFNEVSCTKDCSDRGRCQYDFANTQYSCKFQIPYNGEYCKNVRAISYHFSALGAQGNAGPASTADYTNTTLEGTVTLDKGIQIWTVPFSASYYLIVAGASGGRSNLKGGGSGAVISGTMQLVKGTKLRILVGQRGMKGGTQTAGGGGGGTFVTRSNGRVNVLVAAAGGGGGGGSYFTSKDGDTGQVSESGSVNGGVKGLGGKVNGTETNYAGAGGGYAGNGTCCAFDNSRYTCASCTCDQAGLSFLSGGLGGTTNGGFGGGGAAYNHFPGGGGGFSGGGVFVSSRNSKGGGGGSYYTGGMKPANDTNDGDGYVFMKVQTCLKN